MSAILDPSSGESASYSANSGVSSSPSMGLPGPESHGVLSSSGTTAGKTVILSGSEHPDMDGMGIGILKRSMLDLVSDMLVAGMNISYAGDPRINDMGAELAGKVAKYWRPNDPANTIRFTHYLAWPVHMGMSADEIDKYATRSQRGMRTVLLDMDGMRMTLDERRKMRPRGPDERDWGIGLSVARRAVCMASDCLVAMGGRTAGYYGKMPGVAEEVNEALKAGISVVLIGGFGGCVNDIASAMGITGTAVTSGRQWPGLESFYGMTFDALRNGLSYDDNVMVANEQYGEAVKGAILRGLESA